MNFKPLVLARLGEITLKGQNRRTFEKKLMTTLRQRLKAFGEFKVYQSQSRIWIEPMDEAAMSELDEALEIATTVFGLVSASPVWRLEDEVTTEKLMDGALNFLKMMRAKLEGKRFKIEARRGSKQFAWNSMQIAQELGALFLREIDGLKVDLHEPDVTIFIEVREQISYYCEIVPGLKGLPVGTSGKALLLLSGGIDSPVAGYMMAGRGVALEAIYFHTFPYTSDRTKEKVIDLTKIISRYCGAIKLHVVDFTDIQLTLNEYCPEDMMTVVMRRMMYRIAEKVAENRKCMALITGESLGQVASQTTEALACTDKVTGIPVYRPLIGLDKDDTIEIARKIGTFETSILPYEDCCTVFVAKHPRTRPSLKHAEAAEAKLDVEALTEAGVNKIELIEIPFE